MGIQAQVLHICSCTVRSNLQTRNYFMNYFKLYTSVKTTLNYIQVSSDFKLLTDNPLQWSKTHHTNFWAKVIAPMGVQTYHKSWNYQIWGKFALWIRPSLTHSTALVVATSVQTSYINMESNEFPNTFDLWATHWTCHRSLRAVSTRHICSLLTGMSETTVWKPLVCTRKAFLPWKQGEMSSQ